MRGQLRYATFLGLFIAVITSALCAAPSYAVTNERCFQFTEATGAISGYYNYEGNNTVNPACPKDVSIPNSINGVDVRTINDGSFSSKALMSIELPTTLTHIGQGAFYGNRLDGELTIPETITYIGDSAFAANDLKNVTVPASVSILRSGVFAGNAQLKEADIGSREIAVGVFNGVSNIESLTLRSSVETIRAGAFMNQKLTSLVLPKSIKYVGSSAFSNNQLRTITIPEDGAGVTIENAAFNNNQLTSVSIPSSVTSIGTAFTGNPLDSMFINMRDIPASFNGLNLKSLNFGNNVRTIAAYSITSTGHGALSSLTIPSSVVSIGAGAFIGNQLSSLTLNEGLVSIGDSAFSGNRIASLIVPSTVKSIGANAFGGNGMESLQLKNGVQTIGETAFSGNRIASPLIIPPSVQSIGKEAFLSNAIQSVFINGTVSLGDNAFSANYIGSVSNPTPNYHYTAIFTTDPTNISHYKNTVYFNKHSGEQQGGQLINPARVTVTYKNTSGSELIQQQTITGRSSDGATIHTYAMADGPVFATSQTASEVDAILQSTYLMAGGQYEVSAPAIDGYSVVSPVSPHAFTLTSGDNAVDFTYSHPNDDTTKDLAPTGASVIAIAGSAISACVVAGLLMRRYLI